MSDSPAPYDFGARLAAVKAKPAPAIETPEDAVEEVSEKQGFKSREAATRLKRVRSNEPIDIVSIKGPLSVLNRFKEYANANGHASYWTALDALLKAAERKR